jgi:hypothetical protein
MKAFEEPQKDILEVADIQKILDCGINQAYKLANSKEFHVVRVGRKIKIPRDSFYRWFNGETASVNN